MSGINWLNLNWIDYVIIGIIFLSLLIGLIRGFVCEAISLITWIAAFILAFKFATPLARHFTFVESQTTAYFIAFLAIFIVTLVIGITFNVMVKHLWRHTGVPAMDRVLGFLLGIVRAIFIIAFVMLFVNASPLKDEPHVKGSQLLPLLNPVIKWLGSVLPQRIVRISEWTQEKKKQ